MIHYENFRSGNVEVGTDWTVQNGGFNILRAPSTWSNGAYVNWLEGNVVATSGGAKRVSSHLPEASQDLSKSVEWKCNFKLNTINDEFFRFWPFANHEDVNYLTAGCTGYFLLLTWTAGLFRLYRSAGGGVITAIIDTTWTPDALEHELILTREVSGANRYWRAYLDKVLMGGPTNDATYTSGLYYGFNMDELDRICEIKISS